METEIICPKYGHEFTVENYTSGDCPNCGKASYYWDDDYNEEADECYFPGFYWDEEK
jgi:predicted RNA-binding Zn-ribbon protein involved in translation (DUF1610 family)